MDAGGTRLPGAGTGAAGAGDAGTAGAGAGTGGASPAITTPGVPGTLPAIDPSMLRGLPAGLTPEMLGGIDPNTLGRMLGTPGTGGASPVIPGVTTPGVPPLGPFGTGAMPPGTSPVGGVGGAPGTPPPAVSRSTIPERFMNIDTSSYLDDELFDTASGQQTVKSYYKGRSQYEIFDDIRAKNSKDFLDQRAVYENTKELKNFAVTERGKLVTEVSNLSKQIDDEYAASGNVRNHHIESLEAQRAAKERSYTAYSEKVEVYQKDMEEAEKKFQTAGEKEVAANAMLTKLTVEKKKHRRLEQVQARQYKEDLEKEEKDAQEAERTMTPQQRIQRCTDVENKIKNGELLDKNELLGALNDKSKTGGRLSSTVQDKVLSALKDGHKILATIDGTKFVAVSVKETDPMKIINKLENGEKENITSIGRDQIDYGPFLVSVVHAGGASTDTGYIETVKSTINKLQETSQELPTEFRDKQITFIAHNMKSNIFGKVIVRKGDLEKKAEESQNIINTFLQEVTKGKTKEEVQNLQVNFTSSDVNAGAAATMASSAVKTISDLKVNANIINPGRIYFSDTSETIVNKVDDLSLPQADRMSVNIDYKKLGNPLSDRIKPSESKGLFDKLRAVDKVSVSMTRTLPGGVKKDFHVPTPTIVKHSSPQQDRSSEITNSFVPPQTMLTWQPAPRREKWHHRVFIPPRSEKKEQTQEIIGSDMGGNSLTNGKVETERPTLNMALLLFLAIISFGILAYIYYANFQKRRAQYAFAVNNPAAMNLMSQVPLMTR